MLQKKQHDKENVNEINQIAQKFNKLQAPLSCKTNELIEGLRKPTMEELEEAKQYLSPEEISQIDDNLALDPIDGYWHTVLSNCQLLKDVYILNHDLEIMKYLTRIEYVLEENSHNFTLKFQFKPNEHFENDVLSVRFIMADESEVSETEGTEIKWKYGKDLTKKTVTKKLKNKSTGKTKVVAKIVENESFFHFFETLKGVDQSSEEEADLLLEKLEVSNDIAKIIEDEIIPYHLEYFLGVREEVEDEVEEIGEIEKNQVEKNTKDKKDKKKENNSEDEEEDVTENIWTTTTSG